MKRFLSGGCKKRDQGNKPESTVDDVEGKDGGFLTPDGCLMIYGGVVAYDSMRHRKLVSREVYAAEPATPSFLWWSESAITFDRSDHLESIP